MILVHYKDYFNLMPYINVSKLIGYSDFAIEGFIFLAGYMVGNHYFEQFRVNKKAVITRLLRRAADIIKIHYLMILTISLPLAFLMGNAVTKGDTILVYITKSLLFMNQVGLLHILPTFIPLFLLAIPMLYFLGKGWDSTVLIISLIAFVIGNYNPYIIAIGDKAIFPVMLWQLYFVLGALLGKKAHIKCQHAPDNIHLHLVLALSIYGIMATIYFGHHISGYFEEIKTEYGIVVTKYPLNYLGFLYHGSILYSIICIAAVAWKYICRSNVLHHTVTLVGRHSLLTFVIHVYFAMLLNYINYLVNNSVPLPHIIILINILVTVMVLQKIEERDLQRHIGGCAVVNTAKDHRTVGSPKC